MKKKILIIGIIIVIVGGLSTFFIINNKKKECNKAGIRFKELYEKYNGEVITVNNKKYTLNELTINKENPMSAISKEEIYKQLDEKTTIIFFSSPKDYISRVMLKELLEIAEDNNCETIYYYDVTKLNENYLNDIDVELYEKIINKLGDNITTNFTEKESKKLENGTIIFIKDGEVKKVVEKVSEDYEYGKELTNKEKQELINNINEGFSLMNGGVCEVRQQC